MTDINFEINGYIVNNNHEAFFKIQRRINPGGRVTFENAFKTLGRKSGLRGMEFLLWLKDTHFSDPGWKFINTDGSDFVFGTKVASKDKEEVFIDFPSKKEEASVPKKEEEVAEISPGKGAGKRLERTVKNQVARGTEITPSSIISADYSKAEGMIALCKDRAVLKKALNLSKHFANKEQHMRQIIKRLEQVV